MAVPSTSRGRARRRGRALSTILGIAVENAISREQLQLAARNHGMPLEALAYPITPIGLHYLLIHYDIPVVDATSWRLEVDGDVEWPLSLSLEELRARPSVEVASPGLHRRVC